MRFLFLSNSNSSSVEGLCLYHLPTCLFCWRVRLAMWRMGISLPMKNLLLDSSAQRELVEKGGMMQVPCLRIEEAGSERWLYESGDIINYLKKRFVNG
ncbi:MAG: glutathione S-transferase N-terminal domain-containing protein [Pseudomonadota bacterium]